MSVNDTLKVLEATRRQLEKEAATRHIMLGNLPPMKFNLGEKVRFTFNGHEFVGIVKIADFGGSFEHDYHSYDIFAEDGCFYKHIPEEACRTAE